jgi:uncharacterized protein (DUF1330 family)
MAVYVIAQLSFTNRTTYERYQARFMDVFRRFKSRLLVADEEPSVLEGCWGGDKLVVLSFPDESACREFLDSPDYQEIAVDRRAGADAIILLAKGLGPHHEEDGVRWTIRSVTGRKYIPRRRRVRMRQKRRAWQS